MILYQRMYDRENIQKFYLSPYVEYYIEDFAICFYIFEEKKVVRVYLENGECLIKDLINGITQDDLNQKLYDLFGKRDLAEKILVLLIQNKIIE